MLFKKCASFFSEIESASSRIQMESIFSELISQCSGEIEAEQVVYLSLGKLKPEFYGLDLGVGEKFLMDSISIFSGKPRSAVEKKFRELGDLGFVAEYFSERKSQTSLVSVDLSVSWVYDSFMKIALTSGKNSQSVKKKLLAELLGSSSPIEARYIARFAIGDLRLGIREPTIIGALSLAFFGDRSKRDLIERAFNLRSDIGLVARMLFSGKDLNSVRPELFFPIQPALAERLSSPEEIFSKLGRCAVEYKFDGMRVQCHKKKGDCKIFSRRLEDITDMFPDIVEDMKKIGADDIIFEGEAISYEESTGRFRPFQETMHRKRKHGISSAVEKYPLKVFVFDVLYVDGSETLFLPLSKRRKSLESLFPCGSFEPSFSKVVESPDEIKSLFSEAIEKGLEGIMAKDLNAPYSPGKRKFAWVKLKKSYGSNVDTIDAVVVGYYLGKGSRAKFNFGGLLVAVRNESDDSLETVARIGSGFTEEEMRELESRLSEIRSGLPPKSLRYKVSPDFWVIPKIVVEVAFDDITRSDIHTCMEKDGKGFALRFPRMVRIREDKGVSDITTSSEIRKLYELSK